MKRELPDKIEAELQKKFDDKTDELIVKYEERIKKQEQET